MVDQGIFPTYYFFGGKDGFVKINQHPKAIVIDISTFTHTGTILSTLQGGTEKSAGRTYRLPVLAFFQNSPDFLSKLLKDNGLHDVFSNAYFLSKLLGKTRTKTSTENNGDIGSGFQYLYRKVHTSHARHDLVGKNKIIGKGIFTKQVQGRKGIGLTSYLITKIFQRPQKKQSL